MSTKKSNFPKNELSPVSLVALTSFQENKDKIIKETVQRSLERVQEVAHHGEIAQELLTAGLDFTTKMIEAALSTGEVALLEDELEWAKDRLPHDGVEMEHVLNRLKIYRDVVNETLPSEYAHEINPFLNWMINYQQTLTEEN
jgi:hypothetical protein